MAIITVSREYGSEGTKIGKNLSESLDYLLVDKELIGEVLDKYGLITFNEVIEEKHSIWDRYTYENLQIVDMLSRTMMAFASLDNCVILGRGGFYVLNKYENVLNILIRAPFEKRIENIILRKEAKDIKSATKLLLEKDKLRSAFIRIFYGVHCKDTDMYNLVLDTSKIRNDTAVKWVSEAAAEIDAADIDMKKSTLGLKIDGILAETIKSVLK